MPFLLRLPSSASLVSEIKRNELREMNTFSTYKPVGLSVFTLIWDVSEFACFFCTLIYTPVRNVNCKNALKSFSCNVFIFLHSFSTHRMLDSIKEKIFCFECLDECEHVGLSRIAIVLSRWFENNAKLFCNRAEDKWAKIYLERLRWWGMWRCQGVVGNNFVTGEPTV